MTDRLLFARCCPHCGLEAMVRDDDVYICRCQWPGLCGKEYYGNSDERCMLPKTHDGFHEFAGVEEGRKWRREWTDDAAATGVVERGEFSR